MKKILANDGIADDGKKMLEEGLTGFILDGQTFDLEGVLRSVADATVGSIYGWGFAPFHGGALQFINALGAKAFVARARELAQACGTRFEPAAIVVQLAERGGEFAD